MFSCNLFEFFHGQHAQLKRRLRRKSLSICRLNGLEPLEDRRLLTFSPAVDYAVGANPSDLTLAWVNADIQPDLILANNSPNQGSVRLGNADATFQGPQSTGVTTTSLTTGDLTGDGATDLVSLNTSVLLQTGNGNGTFQSPQSISLPPQVAPGNPEPTPLPQSLNSVVVGDLNADGKLDLVVAGQTSFSVYEGYYTCGYHGCGYIGWWVTHRDGYVNVLMGNGSGFTAPVVIPLGREHAPVAIAIGDLNGDGNADVLTANQYDLSSLLGNGTGTLAAPIHSPSGYSTLRSVALADFDGDSRLDTMTAWGNSLTIQKGQGDGTFKRSLDIHTGHSVDSAAVGDVNGDGSLDLVAVGTHFTCTSSGYYGCYSGDHSGQSSVLLGNGMGGFTLPIISPLGTDFPGAFVDVALADLNGDDLPELVTIESTTGLAIVTTNDGDWVAPVMLSISDSTVVEGHTGTVYAEFEVTLASPSTRDVSVQYATVDLSAYEEYYFGLTATTGVDYTDSTGTLTIPMGQTSGTIRVPVNGDRVGEPNELFFLNLLHPAYAVLARGRALGTIVDDEPYVSFNYFTAPEVVEGNSGTKPMTFLVELSARSDVAVTVDYTTNDGSASAGSDYQAATGTMTFAPGETTRTLTVQAIGDTQPENDEYFYVNLGNATNASIGFSYAIGYIQDDDSVTAISISDASIYEGNRGTKLLTFMVSLSQVSTQPVQVNYATVNGTAKASDKDYTAKSGTLYFSPGEYTKTISVVIKGDKKKEPDEYFYVRLSSPVNGTIQTDLATGTIWDDDGNLHFYASAVDLVFEELAKERLKKRF